MIPHFRLADVEILVNLISFHALKMPYICFEIIHTINFITLASISYLQIFKSTHVVFTIHNFLTTISKTKAKSVRKINYFRKMLLFNIIRRYSFYVD